MQVLIGGFWWQSIAVKGSRQKFTGAFVHLLSSPCSRALYLLRECRKMFQKIPGSRWILLERPGRQSWFPGGAVWLQGWWHCCWSSSWSSQCHLQPKGSSCPRAGPPSVSISPQHCFCTKATLLHNNLKYGIRSEERKAAVHRKLYLKVPTAIQRCRVYLALCVGTSRHQTLTMHTSNRKLSWHLFKGTDQTHQVRIQVTTCWYLVQLPGSWSINSSPQPQCDMMLSKDREQQILFTDTTYQKDDHARLCSRYWKCLKVSLPKQKSKINQYIKDILKGGGQFSNSI